MKSLHIVIADDELIQIKHMIQLINQACHNIEVEVSIDAFESGEAFLFALEENSEWELVFLDIEMADLSGMEVAHYIHDKAPHIHIVFATAYAEYAIEGYRVNALDFLLKPITLDGVQGVIEKYIRIKPQDESFVIIEDIDKNKHVIEVNQIIYVEVQSRELSVYLSDDMLILHGSLANFKKELPSFFISPHRSYLVNLNHVESLSKAYVSLTNGVQVPLSRRLVKEVQQAFIDHFRRGAFYE